MYLIMVAQFQSLLSPFIILFTIPLAFTGGFLGLYVSGSEVSVIAMIGLSPASLQIHTARQSRRQPGATPVLLTATRLFIRAEPSILLRQFPAAGGRNGEAGGDPHRGPHQAAPSADDRPDHHIGPVHHGVQQGHGLRSHARYAQVPSLCILVCGHPTAGVDYAFPRIPAEDIRVSTITERAGIGKGTAYEYFDTKDEIVACAVVSQIRWMFGWLGEQLEAKGKMRTKTLRGTTREQQRAPP